MNNQDNTAKIIVTAILAILVLITLIASITIIKPGERGVVVRLGEINRVMDPGPHFKLPFLEKVKKADVRTLLIERNATSASKDLQVVETKVGLNYNLAPDAVDTLYQTVGKEYVSKIINPAIQNSVKAATALFNAEALITQRPEVIQVILADLQTRLAVNHIEVTEIAITDFKFSDEFDRAIEAKVTAEQKALEAENKLAQVEFEAQQRIATAEAEAEAIRIQANAINSQGGADYVQLKAIEQWDGVLPAQFVPGSAIPFINI